MSESGKKTSTVSPDQGTTGEPATPKREGTAEKTKQTPRKYIFVRSEELSKLLKKLKKNIEPGQGLLTLTWGIRTSGDINIGSRRSKSDYLNVFRTICCLANIVYNWVNGRKVQMVRWVCVGTHSLPLILTTLVKLEKLPTMYNCVKCVYICVIFCFDFYW